MEKIMEKKEITDKKIEDTFRESTSKEEQTTSPSLSPSHIESSSQTQISDKNVEDISSESTSEKGKIASPSFSSSYIKSYSQTKVESTMLDYTWKIDQFSLVCRAKSKLYSPLFSDKGQYTMRIQANFELFNDSVLINRSICSIRLYTLTSNEFFSSCNVTIKYPPEKDLSSQLIWHRLSNMKLLMEVPKFVVEYIDCKDALIIHCKFEIFHDVIYDTIDMKLLPLSTVFSKDAKYEDSTFDDIQSTVEESITFIIKNEEYIISKKLLCATNSTYFKNCVTNGDKVKNMTNILKTDQYQAFKQILLYIKTGSIYELQHNYDHAMLKQLLVTTAMFDMPALKLTCEHYLLRDMTINNALELMDLASSCNAEFLKARLAAFIKFHVNEIANTKEFRDLPEINLRKKIELI